MVMLTGCGSSKETIKFGTAAIGGTYRMFGDTFTEMLTDKNENYDYLSDNIKTIYSTDIYKGIKIKYQNKIYDYSLNERNV